MLQIVGLYPSWDDVIDVLSSFITGRNIPIVLSSNSIGTFSNPI
jgi:hypothetical protein